MRNLEYNVFALVPDDKSKDEILRTGIKTYFYKYEKSWKALFGIISNFFFFKNIFKKENPDMVFTYKFFPNLVGIYIAHIMKIKKIVGTVAGLGFLEKQNRSLFVNIIFKVYIYVLNKAQYIIVQNSEDKKLIGKYIDEKKLILTNGSGVNKSSFTVDASFYCRDNWDLKKECKYFLFCSRIVKDKGIFELITAFNEISKKELDVGLIIAGWFDDKTIESTILDEIKNSKNIFYVGYQKDVKELISLSDCIILPSYYPEGVPRSLTEALALSKPVITTDHRGCRETCEDGVNGFLIKVKDSKDIEEKILKFINLNNTEIQKMSKSSHDLFNRKFEQEIVFKTIMDNII
ncbi:glycosyl transferase [Spirochaetia bacterium]|nr:glycosyl transferase [Spirochaetia bacterium]